MANLWPAQTTKLHIPVVLGYRPRWASTRDEMWSEGRYDYERLPRERVPPRSHPSDEFGYRWARDDHSTSRQSDYRDMRDGFRRKSFYSSHYSRDRSPHKRDAPFFRESPVGRKDSPHSRSGSSVSSRSYSPERSRTHTFHQSQHRSMSAFLVSSQKCLCYSISMEERPDKTFFFFNNFKHSNVTE